MSNQNFRERTQEFVNELQANDLLLSLPIDVERIAVGMGLKVVGFPFQDDISGVLVIDETGATIGYNPSESNVRKRFSIAHELGHYVLHSKKNTSETFLDKLLFRKNITMYSSKEEAIEREANYFAANILMPANVVVNEVNKLSAAKDDEDNIKILSKKFDVSVSAMTYRLVNLGIYKWTPYDSSDSESKNRVHF
jgi:Zn-dependent peptidase ImmA (M78 family)